MTDDQIPVIPSQITELNLRAHSAPAAYVLTHSVSGKRYVGSTENLYVRISLHRSRLKAGTHDNKNLQAAYNENPRFDLSAVFTDDKEAALDIEQALLDGGRESGDLLNIAHDARRAGAGVVISDDRRKKMSDQGRARFLDPKTRSDHSERMKVAMSDPCLRAAQSERAKRLMDNPEHKAKMIAATSTPVVVDGVRYSSIKEAAEETGINRSTLSSRIRRQKKR